MSPRMGQELALALALEGRIDAVPAETASLVALATELQALPEPEIDMNFAAALEQRLLTEGLEEAPVRPQLQVVRSIPETPADEVVRRAEVVRLPRRRYTVRRSIAAVAAAAMLSAFPVAATASSLPGSPFYGLKLFTERAQLAMFGGEVADAFTHVSLAERRIDEARQLTELGAAQDLIAGTLAAADEELRAALGLVEKASPGTGTLQRFAAAAREAEKALQEVRPALAATAEAVAVEAIRTSREIQKVVALALGFEVAPVTDAGAEAMPLPVTAAQPATPAQGSSSSQGQQQSSQRTESKGSDGSKGRTATDDAATGKEVRGVTEGCRAPGSSELNDALAFLCRTDAYTELMD